MLFWIDDNIIKNHVGIRRTIYNLALLAKRSAVSISFMLVEPDFQKKGLVREWVPETQYLTNNGFNYEGFHLPKVIIQELSKVDSSTQIFSSPMTFLNMDLERHNFNPSKTWLFVPDVTPVEYAITKSENFWNFASTHTEALALAKKFKLGVLTCSTQTRVDICEFIEMPRNEIEVINPGVYVEHLENFKQMKPPQQKFLQATNLLMVNILDRRKGLLRILEPLQNSELNRITVIGPRRCTLEDVILFQKSCKSKVFKHFEGASISVMVENYSSADLMVFPSISEGYGIPALEASYFGLPLMVSEGLPVNSDLLTHKVVADWSEVKSFKNEIMEKPNWNDLAQYRAELHTGAQSWMTKIVS
jgi:glycosyltransferase involved in cell wall biosynthesis